jgi:hypothetical protein
LKTNKDKNYNAKLHLVYVLWFDCKHNLKAITEKMYLFAKISRREIIVIQNIKKSVYFIFKFKTKVESTYAISQQLRQLQNMYIIKQKRIKDLKQSFLSWSNLIIIQNSDWTVDLISTCTKEYIDKEYWIDWIYLIYFKHFSNCAFLQATSNIFQNVLIYFKML